MLVPPWHPRAKGVQELHAEFMLTERAAWLPLSSHTSPLSIAADDWSNVQRVVLDGDSSIVGLVGACIDRDVRAVSQLHAVAYVEGSPAFAVGLRRFMAELIASYEVVRWSAVVGSPNVDLYRRAIVPLGGRVCGTFSRFGRQPSGQLVDVEWYEVIGKGGR